MRELAEHIHHHLRTPLTAVRGHSDLLLEHGSELPAHLQVSIDGILRAAARLDEVVASICDLVDVVCGCSGALEVVDVSELLVRQVSTSRQAAAAAAVRLHHVGTEGAVCTADPEHIGRAIRALLEHAIAHAAPRSEVGATTTRIGTVTRVTVRWHPASRGDDRTQDPEQCQGTTPTDDGTLRVALASAVAQACGGRLRILGGEHTTDVSIELDLPRRAGPRDG